MLITPSGLTRTTKGSDPVVVIGVGRDDGARRHLDRLLTGLKYEDSANFASTEF